MVVHIDSDWYGTSGCMRSLVLYVSIKSNCTVAPGLQLSSNIVL